MSTDLLRIEANERLDLRDLQYFLDTSLQNNTRQPNDQILTNPSGTRTWVLDGFAPSKGAGETVQITRGRAILGQRDGSQILYGVLTTEGDASQSVDVSGFSNGTYGIYIRFEYKDGDIQSRVFWNSSGNGSETTKSIATKRLANWSTRLETTNPGAEWTKIGNVIVTGGAITQLIDLRDMYFEGSANYEVYPTPQSLGTEYQSGWSSDGGGLATDRSIDRKSLGTMDLQKSLSAVRQCIEDIKGRGLRRWWDRDIGGVNIGFDAAPLEDQVRVGDVDFGLQLVSSTESRINLDTANSDYIKYDRATNALETYLSGLKSLSVFESSTARVAELLGTDGGAIQDSSKFIFNDGTNAPYIGLVGTAGAGSYAVGDLRFVGASGAESFRIRQNTGDMYFSRIVNFNNIMRLDNQNFSIAKGPTSFNALAPIHIKGTESSSPGVNRAFIRLEDTSAVESWTFNVFGSASVEGTGKFGVQQVSTSLNRVVIDTNGNVGIHETSPLDMLHLTGDETVADVDRASISLQDITAAQRWKVGVLGTAQGTSSGDFNISQIGIGTRLSLTDTGWMGLNTVAPGALVDILPPTVGNASFARVRNIETAAKSAVLYTGLFGDTWISNIAGSVGNLPTSTNSNNEHIRIASDNQIIFNISNRYITTWSSGAAKPGDVNGDASWAISQAGTFYPLAGPNLLDIGDTVSRVRRYYGERAAYREELIQPLNQEDLSTRHGNNCILAWGETDGSSGGPSLGGAHYNILNIQRVSLGNYQVNLDQEVRVESCIIPIPKTTHALVHGSGGFIGSPASKTIQIQFVDNNGNLQDAQFFLSVIGRPMTL